MVQISESRVVIGAFQSMMIVVRATEISNERQRVKHEGMTFHVDGRTSTRNHLGMNTSASTIFEIQIKSWTPSCTSGRLSQDSMRVKPSFKSISVGILPVDVRFHPAASAIRLLRRTAMWWHIPIGRVPLVVESAVSYKATWDCKKNTDEALKSMR